MAGNTVILADGLFPSHMIPLGYLTSAERIVCCDGAVKALIDFGLEPFAIVGDCDSVSPEIETKYANRIFRTEEHETNDLTKSVKWCHEHGYSGIVILGATGKREDHTIGNISLLTEYIRFTEVIMVTDTGILYPVTESRIFYSFPGQCVSVFSINNETEITSSGLKYPLFARKLRNWWEATLNEAVSDTFCLNFKGGPLIVYLKFID